LLQAFGKPERLLACECERSNTTTLSQAFALISGPELHQRISLAGNRIDRLARSAKSDAEIIDELYWAALTRPPRPQERKAMLARLSSGDRLDGLQDIAWALLNAKEFVFRR
jgi:hypothetical protein